MSDERIPKIVEIIEKAKTEHAVLIEQFTKGGILDPVKGPLLKIEILRYERFFTEMNIESLDEMVQVIKRHFPFETLE